MSYLFNCYSGVYDKFMKVFHLQETLIIEDYLNHKNLMILDIGGGTGTLADKLQRNGHSVTILDSSEAMLKQAKKKNDQLILIHSLLKENLNIPKQDIIICRDCFHHLTNQKDSLRIMINYLKENGELIIHDFQPTSLRIKLLFLFERCCFEKITPITSSRLEELCKQLDLKISFLYLGKWDYICKITI
ncbi:MAG: class I SAM-dependent methyltransferase [Coprobacillus sp.]